MLTLRENPKSTWRVYRPLNRMRKLGVRGGAELRLWHYHTVYDKKFVPYVYRKFRNVRKPTNA